MALWSLESIVRLGWSYAKTLVRSVAERPHELPRFIAQYQPDGMLSREPGDLDVIVAAGRCIACARCDLRAMELGAFDALGPRGPMAFVQGVSRQPGIDDSTTAQATRTLLDALTVTCPVEIPFVPLAAMVRRRHRELTEARARAASDKQLPAPQRATT